MSKKIKIMENNDCPFMRYRPSGVVPIVCGYTPDCPLDDDREEEMRNILMDILKDNYGITIHNLDRICSFFNHPKCLIYCFCGAKKYDAEEKKLCEKK